MKHRKEAFTLIELLVVIAIIAILMGILMPALGKARKQAQGVRCRGNLRQVGMAANLYAQDNDQYIPRGLNYAESTVWFTRFLPYLSQNTAGNDYRNVKIYRCPSYPDKDQTICYVINGWKFSGKGDKVGEQEGEPTRILSARHRADTIYIADDERGSRGIIETADDPDLPLYDVWAPEHLPYDSQGNLNGGRRVAAERHNKGCNLLYLDWHVDWISSLDIDVDMWRFDD